MRSISYIFKVEYFCFVVNVLEFKKGCNLPQEGERTKSAPLYSSDSATLPFGAGVMSAESPHREEALSRSLISLSSPLSLILRLTFHSEALINRIFSRALRRRALTSTSDRSGIKYHKLI